MKRFDDLDSKQKKLAIDFMFNRNMDNVNIAGVGEPDKIKARIAEIKVKMKFCGCLDCENLLGTEVRRDSIIKEIVLSRAKTAAFNAYYSDDQDDIVEISKVS